MRTGSETALCLCLALLAPACMLFEEPDSNDAALQEAERDPAEYAEQVDEKLRQFSACRDALGSVMRESWERYSDQVDEGGKLVRRREGLYLRGIESNSFRACRRTIGASPLRELELPRIEQTANELLAAADDYAAATRELASWLRAREDGEGWTKLAEYDARLRTSHGRWQQADTALAEAIDLRHLENDQILLGVLEARRSPLEFATRRLMIRARPMVRCLTREPTPSSPAECEAEWKTFEQAHEQFVAIHDADPQAAAKVFWMKTFALDVDEFHALAAEHQRKLGQRRSKERELEELGAAYSALARDADALDFDFP